MIEWGWSPGNPGKALLIDDGGQLRLVIWEVDRDGRPHHLRAMLQLRLAGPDRIKAILEIDADGNFTFGRPGMGISAEQIDAVVRGLDHRLKPSARRLPGLQSAGNPRPNQDR